MHGIVGIVGRGASEEHRRLTETMIRSMLHGREYISGIQCDPDLGIHAGWVSRAQRSAPPEQFGDEPSVFLSGECLAEPGEEYRKHGEDFVTKLDGSFCGLLVDRRSRRVFLFNDRFGMERIYYHETGDTLFFASEAKALLAILPELRRFDDEGVIEYLTYGSTLRGRTLFRGIRIMPPGSIWAFFDRAQATRRPYFRPTEWQNLPKLTGEQFREELAEEFPKAVHARIGSGERVGISITGGLDTRMIMACLPPVSAAPTCYTFAGVDGETLDVQLGRRVARARGLEHRVLRIGKDFLEGYGAFVDRTVRITDGCAGALGAHEIYLNALASQIAPVRVTGNFGSEILRGMSTFKTLDLSERLLSPDVRERTLALRTSRAVHESHPVLFAAFEEIPTSHFGIPAAARSQLTFRSPFLSNTIVELAVRAPASERASPAACGSVIEKHDPALGGIPTDRGVLPNATGSFRAWSRAFAEITFKLDYWHKEGLPSWLSTVEPLLNLLSGAGLLGLHKFLPYRGWLRKELAGYVRGVLSDASTKSMPWWNADALDRIFLDHQSGQRNHLREIDVILTLEAVQRCLLGANSSREQRTEGTCGL